MRKFIFFILFIGLILSDLYSQTWTYYTNPGWDFETDNYGRTHIIAADVYGNLWLAPDSNGLWKFDIAQNKFISYQSVITDTIYSIYVEDEKNIWIGTKTNGIYLFDGTNIIEHYYDGPPHYYSMPNNIYDLLVDGIGNVVFTVDKSGSENVVMEFDKNNTFTMHDEGIVPKLRQLAINSNGMKIYINGTTESIQIITVGNYEDIIGCNPAGTLVMDYAIDFNNNRWVSVAQNAEYPGWLVKITPYPDDTIYDYDETVCSNLVHKLMVDNDNRIVCGLKQNGVAIYDGVTWEYYTTANGLAEASVYAVAQTMDGDYWFFHDYPGGKISRLHIPGREGFQLLSFESNSGYSNSITRYLKITGTGFKNGAKVKLTRDGENDIWATETIVVDNHTMLCRFNLTNARTGKWGLMAYNHYRWPQFNYKMYKAGIYEITAKAVDISSTPDAGSAGTEEDNINIPDTSAKVYQNRMNLNKGEEAKIVLGKEVRAVIKIYTIRGDLVKEYEERDYKAGEYVEWDGTYMNTGREVGAGIYIVIINGNGINEKLKVIVTK